jgi:hypothetical protein
MLNFVFPLPVAEILTDCLKPQHDCLQCVPFLGKH